MHLRTALLVMTVVITAGLPPVRADWMEPLPKGAPSLFPWDQVTGYWVRSDDKRNFLYLSPEGLLDSTLSNGASAYQFGGRGKIVRELKHISPDVLAELVMVTDEQFCDENEIKRNPSFRVVSLRKYGGKETLTIDIATHVDPPAKPMKISSDILWKHFRRDAERSMYKDEGYWHHIEESDAPQWFRDQVARLVLSGRFACEPAK